MAAVSTAAATGNSSLGVDSAAIGKPTPAAAEVGPGAGLLGKAAAPAVAVPGPTLKRCNKNNSL